MDGQRRTVSRLRLIPWVLAVAGLAIPLVHEPSLWPFIVGWVVAIAIAWLIGRAIPSTRQHRMAAALILLPVLFMLGWWGGWWLIPADIGWLVVEALDRDATNMGQ